MQVGAANADLHCTVLVYELYSSCLGIHRFSAASAVLPGYNHSSVFLHVSPAPPIVNESCMGEGADGKSVRDTSPQMDRAKYQMPPWEARQLTQVSIHGDDVQFTPSIGRQGSDSNISGRSSSIVSEDVRNIDRKGSILQQNEYPSWQRRPSEAPSVGSTRDGYTIAAPRTSPNALTFLPRASPSPRGIVSKQRLQTSFEIPPDKAELKALPGTMSARTSADQSRSKVQCASRSIRPDNVHAQEDTPGFGRKLKAAMKEFFHRSPIDESNFEKIKDRHWSEEDY